MEVAKVLAPSFLLGELSFPFLLDCADGNKYIGTNGRLKVQT